MDRSFGNVERRKAGPLDQAGVEFKIASTCEELNQSCRLVYKAYRDIGLIAANRFHMRVTPYHLLDTSEVLIATLAGQVISTGLLIRDGKLGLPMESIYGIEVEQRRSQGIHVAEASCLADRRNEFHWAFPVLVRLMSLIVQCAAFRGVDQLLIAVHPRHGRFYRRYLGFELIGSERTYATVQGKPAVALTLDLNRLAETHSPGYRTLFGERFAADILQPRAMDEQWRNEARVIAETSSPSNGQEQSLLNQGRTQEYPTGIIEGNFPGCYNQAKVN